MNYRDDRPATRSDLEYLEQRLAYRIVVLGAVIVYCLVLMFMMLKW
jgi:hypothetical protein